MDLSETVSCPAPRDTRPRVLVFGATSAIAQAAARIWAARGARLHLVGRDPARLAAVRDDLAVRAGDPGRVSLAVADLDDVDRHDALIDAACAVLGGLDIVLVAQGTLPDQAACEADPALALHALHTNGVAVVALCARLAPRLQARRGGVLAVIGSVAGDRGRQSNYTYGAAKGLVDLYLQGLRHRLHRDGVAVVTLKPGFVDTPMTAAIGPKGPLWATPGQVGLGIVRACDRRTRVAYLPGFWRPVMALIRALPEPLFLRTRL